MVTINLGAAPNDGTGTPLRTAGGYLNDTGLRKNNFAAGSTAPTTSNDNTQGYETGSLWLLTSGGNAGDLYYAKSVGTGTAEWILVLSSNGAGDPAAKSTLVSADDILILDSAASDVVKAVPATEFRRETLVIACSDETTALTTGTSKVKFRMPWAMTLTDVRISVGTAPTGSTILVDVNEGGVSIFSTRPSIDISELTSVTGATQRVISDTSLADDAEITVDIDQVGSTIAGAGLKLYLIGYRT